MKYRNVRSWLLLLIIASSIFAISATPYAPAHSIYNESDQGTSSLRSEMEKFDLNISRMLISPIILNTENNIDVVIIIGSERKYTSAEIDAYEAFVKRGGLLFIFEDFGPAKQIASRMGITYLPGRLRDLYPPIHVNRPSQMFIRDILISQVVETGELALLANDAVSLIDFDGLLKGTSIPILMTYPSTFVDTNDNNVLESVDIYSPIGLPLGFMKIIGEGMLFVVGDSSIPQNQYWQKTIRVDDNDIILANAFWTLVVLTTLINTYGKSQVVFDESHQAIVLNSAAGLFNLLAGTWVGIWNTIEVTAILTVFTIGFARRRVKMKKQGSRRFQRIRDTNIQKRENDSLLTNPSSAEKAIAEQYLLYNVMDDKFIQVANTDLVNKIIAIKKGEDFINHLKTEYGILNFEEVQRMETLFEIHNRLRNFVQENADKWL